jgi:repressor LexA
VKEDDTVTLKRVYKRPNDILLKPENDDFSPILLKDCQVRGKLIGVIRNF